jgi:hypothetical protein
MRHPRKLVNGRTKPFFWMLNEVIDNGHLARLGPNTFAVYAVLHRWSEKNDVVEISVEALCQQSGLARNTVRKAIKRLLRTKYLHRRRPAGGTTPASYILTDPPAGGQTVTPRGSSRDPLEGQAVTPSPPPVQINDLGESKREVESSSSNNRSSANRAAEQATVLREERGEHHSASEQSAAAALLEGIGVDREVALFTARCAWGYVGSDALMARVSDVIVFGEKGLEEGRIKRTLPSYVIAALQRNYVVAQRKKRDKTPEEKKREADQRVASSVAAAADRRKANLEAAAKAQADRDAAEKLIAEAAPEEVAAAIERVKASTPALAKATLLKSTALNILVAQTLRGEKAVGSV